METPSAVPTRLRKIRSFVRRPGRATAAQRRAFAELLPRFNADAAHGPLDLARVFGRDARRVLDIGFGDGEALVTNALNNPSVDYLGIEVHEPGVGHLLLLLEQAAVTNVRVIVRDVADVVPELLADTTFDVVDLFFPDPWPKKRHHKRRLVQPPFIAELARVLRPNGLLHVATDWADYARHTREVLAIATQFQPAEPADVSGEPLALRPPTKFERRGVRLGHEVADLYYRARVWTRAAQIATSTEGTAIEAVIAKNTP
jgi:tRNA (guanine-N7-)-methyltransferase